MYPLQPAVGKDGRVGPDALGLTAVGFVELRAFAHGGVDLLGEVGGR